MGSHTSLVSRRFSPMPVGKASRHRWPLLRRHLQGLPGDLHSIGIGETRPPDWNAIRLCADALNGVIGVLRFRISIARSGKLGPEMFEHTRSALSLLDVDVAANGGSISSAIRAEPFVISSRSGISISVAVCCRFAARSPVPAKASM